jgi:hypothetical protein
MNIDSEKKKAFVFDTTKGFARFVKINYSKYFNFESCTNVKNFSDIDLTHVKVAFVLINSDDEMLQLMNIYSNVEIIFLSSKIKFDLSVYKMDKIFYINHGQKKSDYINQVNYKLKEFNII